MWMVTIAAVFGGRLVAVVLSGAEFFAAAATYLGLRRLRLLRTPDRAR